jgi:hypothetical protein
LHDFSDCERRFYLRYIEQLAWPAVESEPVMENERRQLEGEIFHRLVQQYWLGLPVEKLSRLANSPELSQWWSNYLDYDFKLDGFATFPEMTLTAPVGNHKLTAKYDLVAVGADKVIIFDWKTYQKKPKETNLAVCYQTRVYRSLMVKAGGCLSPSSLNRSK